MWSMLFNFFVVVCILGLVAVAALFAHGMITGKSPTAALFGPRPEKRLEVVDHASVDGRRRLVLIRRDNVEHLIMTGGPVDVVIETGIESRHGYVNGEDTRTPPTLPQARTTFGQKSSET